MIWIKRLTLLLAGLLLGLVLTIAGALLVFDDADYRRVLAWSADHLLDSELVITGPLSIGYSEGLLVSVGGVRLRAHDDSYFLETETFSANIYPSSIMSGVLWINALTLDGLRLKIAEPEDVAESFAFNLPPVVVARARINRLLVEYQEAPPGTLHTFTLDELLIEGASEASPVTVQAHGSFEGQEFRLDGILPPLETLQAEGTPKPLKLDFDSEKITASLDGSVVDLVTGKGMDLALEVSAQGLHEYIEIFADGIPALGKLDATARLRGDYNSPRLDDLDLHLQRGDAVSLDIKGSVPDIRTGEGLQLRISGQSDNPSVLSWTLFRQQDRLSSVKLDMGLQLQDSRYLVHDLDMRAATPEGLKIAVSGSGELHAAGHRFSKRDAGFTVKVNAPKTSAFNMLGRQDFPDFGQVSGTALLAVGLDAVGLYGMNVNIGNKAGTHASVAGDIGYIPLDVEAAPGNTDLKVSFHTRDFEGLGKRLGYKWPNMGAASLTGDLGIQKTRLQLDNARLNMGDQQQPTIKATGRMATELNKGSTIDLEFNVAVTDLVAALTGKTPGYLGRLQGNVDISDMDGSWGIEKIDLVSTQSNLYEINISGRYDDLAQFDKANLMMSLAVTDMTALGKALEMDLSGYGAYRAKGVFTSNKGKYSYRGSASLGRSASTTELDGYLKDGKPQLTGKFELPVLYLADIGITDEFLEPSGDAVKPTSGRNAVFSRKPLNTAFLNNFNLEFDLAVDEVKGEELSIESLNAHVSLQDGHLRVSPFRMVFEKGDSDIYIDVQDGELPAYQVKITADDLELGPLLAQVQNEVPIRGYSNIDLDLTAKGSSQYELASSLSGKASLGLENARIPGKHVEFLSADVLGWVFSKSVARESYVNLNCVVVSFDVNNGQVTSQVIIADGPRLSLGGRINLNLKEETLDIVLVPKQKKKLFSSISPVKIHGPMNDPVVEAIPAKAAIQEIGALALLPGVFIPVKAVEKLWGMLSDGDKVGEGCAGLDAIGEAAVKKLKKTAE